MEVFIFWLLFSVVVGIIASSRGRSGFGWFLLSIIISPLLSLILVALLPSLKTAAPVAGPNPQPAAPSVDQLRKCPECAELILREARRCKHCGSAVTPMTQTTAAHVGEAAVTNTTETAPYRGTTGYRVGAALGRAMGYPQMTDADTKKSKE